jgi:hypothetical protein
MNKTQTVICLLAFLMASFSFGCASSADQSPKRTKYSRGSPQQGSKITHDSIEDDPNYKSVFASIDAEVDEKLKDHPMRGSMGYCHVFWDTKKKILREKYGIHWRSPAEMNPHILFD